MVVEAGASSGSMAVARWTHDLECFVGAVPGPITSATSVGPHQLLSEGFAHVVSRADDIKLIDPSERTRLQNDPWGQHLQGPPCRLPSNIRTGERFSCDDRTDVRTLSDTSATGCLRPNRLIGWTRLPHPSRQAPQ